MFETQRSKTGRQECQSQIGVLDFDVGYLKPLQPPTDQSFKRGWTARHPIQWICGFLRWTGGAGDFG